MKQTGEELGKELLRMLAESNNERTADITLRSQQLSKSEYDNFYYMSQIGNLIVYLSKQETSFVHQFWRWFIPIENSVDEILRAEKTVAENPNMNSEHLWTLVNFSNDSCCDNVTRIQTNYDLLHTSFRGLLAADELIRILIKTYQLPFMRTFCYDIPSITEGFKFFNKKIDELAKYKTPENSQYIVLFHKINEEDMVLDKDMVKLTERVAFLSKFDSLILQWCSNYEVILNNLMGFELFSNPDWILSYLRPNGNKYGSFKYPEKIGVYEGKGYGKEN